MEDNSPIVLHLKTGDRTFDFFLFSLAMYDVILYENDITAEDAAKAPGGTSVDTYNNLQKLFQEAPEEDGAEIAVSIRHLLVLLSVLDHISKVLLGSNADERIAYLGSRFPGLPENWVTGYLQNAGQVFGTFRRKFSANVGMEALLERITSLNRFQDS